MCPKIYSSVISKKWELTLSFLSRIRSYNEVPHVNIPYLMPLRMIIWLWLDICVGHLGDNGYASASVFVFGRTDIFICYCTISFLLSIHFCSFVSICASFCQCKAKYLIAIIGCAQEEDASKTSNQELADTFDVELAVALKCSQMTVIPAQAPVRHVARKCVCRTISTSSSS